ncbi:putative spore protein YtfJ [Sporosarcina luteola]|nr:putative spore protein YtfJ [Sporosarcina luteola]
MSQKNKQKNIATPVQTIFNKFADCRDITLVYDEPIEVGLKKVVPVAKVKYAVGGGGDGNGGEGGGGSFSIQPVGVYEISPDKLTFTSVKHMQRQNVLILILIGLIGLLLFRKKKRR